jgi:hypothetical protein
MAFNAQRIEASVNGEDEGKAVGVLNKFVEDAKKELNK